MKNNELVNLLSFKADKSDLLFNMKKKVGKKDIQRVIEIMHHIQNQIKHLIVLTSEKVRNDLWYDTATENELISKNSSLLKQIDDIYKWICDCETKYFKGKRSYKKYQSVFQLWILDS